MHAPHYVVTWKGKATAWKVTLRVGKKILTAKVAGSKHAHTFTLRGGKGAVSATVKAGYASRRPLKPAAFAAGQRGVTPAGCGPRARP